MEAEPGKKAAMLIAIKDCICGACVERPICSKSVNPFTKELLLM